MCGCTCIASAKGLGHMSNDMSGDMLTDMCPMWKHYYGHACHAEVTTDTFIRELCVTTGLVACMHTKPWIAELNTKRWQWQGCGQWSWGPGISKRSILINVLSVPGFSHAIMNGGIHSSTPNLTLLIQHVKIPKSTNKSYICNVCLWQSCLKSKVCVAVAATTMERDTTTTPPVTSTTTTGMNCAWYRHN